MPIWGQPPAKGEAAPILGVAQCLNKRDGESFTAQDEQMMAALCSLFSVCLLNATVFERERRLHRQKQALLELASTLSTKLELLPLVRSVRSAACSVMRAERCTLYLVDQVRREHRLVRGV